MPGQDAMKFPAGLEAIAHVLGGAAGPKMDEYDFHMLRDLLEGRVSTLLYLILSDLTDTPLESDWKVQAAAAWRTEPMFRNHVIALIKALITTVTEAGGIARGFEPIATAPKEYEVDMLLTDGKCVWVGYRITCDGDCWGTLNCGATSATHWAPLPALPKGD